MPVRDDHTDAPTVTLLAALAGDAWTEEVVPHLPADLAAQARALGAFRRARGLATPTDLLRALLVFALDGLSIRGLGVWAILLGLADVSEAAWRKRLRTSRAWLGWLLAALLAAEAPAAPRLAGRGRRIRLVDATRLAQVGGTGDDWRVHLAYDLLAGRMDEVAVSDRHTAEGLEHVTPRPGDILVGDRGYGYRRHVATARAAAADVVLRIDPRACPLEDAAGQPFDVEAWLLTRPGSPAVWSGWCVWAGRRHPVRLIASALPPGQRRRARKRKQRQAKKKGRRVSARTLRLAGWWLLLTTLAAAAWPAADVVRLYRARWQVELLFKRLKQLLAGAAIRARTRAAAEATVRALLVAWALAERMAAGLRAALPADPARPVSGWRLAQVSLATLAQAVRGHWTVAHLRACLPRLARFLTDAPRRRAQQAATVRAWLDAHPGRATAPEAVAA
jgi:Transposase DDE domain